MHTDRVLIFFKKAQKAWQAPCLPNAAKGSAGVLCLSPLNSGACHNLCWGSSINSHKLGSSSSSPQGFLLISSLPRAHTRTHNTRRAPGVTSTRCREMSVSEEHWRGPVVSHCWVMIDVHSARLLFYHKATKETFIPLKAKAVLTLRSLTNTEELVAEMACWEQLNAA